MTHLSSRFFSELAFLPAVKHGKILFVLSNSFCIQKTLVNSNMAFCIKLLFLYLSKFEYLMECSLAYNLSDHYNLALEIFTPYLTCYTIYSSLNRPKSVNIMKVII